MIISPVILEILDTFKTKLNESNITLFDKFAYAPTLNFKKEIISFPRVFKDDVIGEIVDEGELKKIQEWGIIGWNRNGIKKVDSSIVKRPFKLKIETNDSNVKQVFDMHPASFDMKVCVFLSSIDTAEDIEEILFPTFFNRKVGTSSNPILSNMPIGFSEISNYELEVFIHSNSLTVCSCCVDFTVDCFIPNNPEDRRIIQKIIFETYNGRYDSLNKVIYGNKLNRIEIP